MKKSIAVLMSLLMLFALLVPAYAAKSEDLPYPDSRFFDYRDYRVHYRVLRAADEKDQILFLHGFAASTYCWNNLAAILTENGYTCVLVDLPDFGFSSRETAQTARLPREDIIHALMTALSDRPWYVAGHSMGGYTALAIAQKYPESVKNLLLYSTAGNNGLFGLLDPLTTNPSTAKSVGRLIEAIGKNPFFVRMIMFWATQDKAYLEGYDYEALMAPYRIEGTGEGIVYSLSTHTKTDYEAVAKMPPMLFLNGSRDLVCPPTERINLRSALPEGSVDTVMEGAGHMLIESRAEETAAITLDFLSKNP